MDASPLVSYGDKQRDEREGRVDGRIVALFTGVYLHVLHLHVPASSSYLLMYRHSARTYPMYLPVERRAPARARV